MVEGTWRRRILLHACITKQQVGHGHHKLPTFSKSTILRCCVSIDATIPCRSSQSNASTHKSFVVYMGWKLLEFVQSKEEKMMMTANKSITPINIP